ncbi:MAG TPA: DinB family protein [Dehalococcoidia bacterium]|nr:DinB family protein [Dehalococcoidia bacterium]
MDAEYFRFLYDYLYWARDKVLAAAEGLSEEEYKRDVGFTYHSVRGILTHALAGEAVWLPRAWREQPGPFLHEDDVPTLAALRERWQAEESKQRAYLAKLTDAEAAGSVTFKGRDGNDRTLPVWQILTMEFHHTVQHRSEAAEALTILGHSPGDLDLVFYTRERGL